MFKLFFSASAAVIILLWVRVPAQPMVALEAQPAIVVEGGYPAPVTPTPSPSPTITPTPTVTPTPDYFGPVPATESVTVRYDGDIIGTSPFSVINPYGLQLWMSDETFVGGEMAVPANYAYLFAEGLTTPGKLRVDTAQGSRDILENGGWCVVKDGGCDGDTSVDASAVDDVPIRVLLPIFAGQQHILIPQTSSARTSSAGTCSTHLCRLGTIRHR